MIFTIGYRENYDAGLAELGAAFRKMGKRDVFRGSQYRGGSVWKTREEAQAHLDANQHRLAGYSVYGVMASWDVDTEQLPGEPFRRLLVDAQIVPVV